MNFNRPVAVSNAAPYFHHYNISDIIISENNINSSEVDYCDENGCISSNIELSNGRKRKFREIKSVSSESNASSTDNDAMDWYSSSDNQQPRHENAVTHSQVLIDEKTKSVSAVCRTCGLIH